MFPCSDDRVGIGLHVLRPIHLAIVEAVGVDTEIVASRIPHRTITACELAPFQLDEIAMHVDEEQVLARVSASLSSQSSLSMMCSTIRSLPASI